MFGIAQKMMMSALVLSAISACSGLNLGTVAMVQNLDMLNDDVAEITFLVDAPLTLLPQDDGLVFLIDATTVQYGNRHIRAVLERGADFSSLSNLPPPANNHTYHLFVFSEADKQAIQEFQKWGLGLQEQYGSAGGNLQFSISPSFCRTVATDVSEETISVLISLPGDAKLNPLLSNVRVSEVGGSSSEGIPVCVQT